MTLSDAMSIGMSFAENVGLPMLTFTSLATPFSAIIVGVIIPANVSTVNTSVSIILRSYAYFAKQRMPLPHISASLPSELIMRMRTSATSDGITMTSPSAPIPVWRSQRRCAIVVTSIWLLPSSKKTIKSFPKPCIFVIFISISLSALYNSYFHTVDS